MNLYFKFVKITFTSYDIAWLLFVISQIILAITLIYSKKSHTIAEASSLAKIDFLDSVKTELSLNTSNTTIINTNTPNIKIKKKNKKADVGHRMDPDAIWVIRQISSKRFASVTELGENKRLTDLRVKEGE